MLFKCDKKSHVLCNKNKAVFTHHCLQTVQKRFVHILDAPILLHLLIRVSFGYILATGRYSMMSESKLCLTSKINQPGQQEDRWIEEDLAETALINLFQGPQ